MHSVRCIFGTERLGRVRGVFKFCGAVAGKNPNPRRTLVARCILQ